jgi:Zn-dependent protease with chaperone function
MMQTASPAGTSPSRGFSVRRWPSEVPLFALACIVSIPLWILLTVSIVGIVYAAGIGVFLFVVHLAMIAHVRGSGVRLSDDQFPEVFTRVQRLAGDMGIRKLPDVYLIQAGGTLNAFATKFLGSNMIVLYTELLDACGDDTAARDMIIAHELGHIHAGHLRWRWLMAPSLIVPFLGTALSRAREYTCDRYGLAGAGDEEGALRGLTILAAGGKHAPRVNRLAFARQRADLQTGWMTIGEWLATHPALAKRVAALAPQLDAGRSSSRGPVRALAILASVVLPFAVVAVVGMRKLPAWLASQARGRPAAAALSPDPGEQASAASLASAAALFGDPSEPAPSAQGAPSAVSPEAARAQVDTDLSRFAALIEAERAAGRPLPWDARALHRLWSEQYAAQDYPFDPFDSGQPYGYDRKGDDYLLWSAGADGESDTDDDIVFDSRVAAGRHERAKSKASSKGR